MNKVIYIAAQLLTAAPLDEVLGSVKVWEILKSEPGAIAWLWDREGSGDFVKGGQQHFELAMKIAKKHKLSKTYEGLEAEAEELLDHAVRGYYFPKANKVAVYPILTGKRHSLAQDDAIYRHVVQKLKVDKETAGIAINDEYAMASDQGMVFSSKSEAIQFLADHTGKKINIS